MDEIIILINEAIDSVDRVLEECKKPYNRDNIQLRHKIYDASEALHNAYREELLALREREHGQD